MKNKYNPPTITILEIIIEGDIIATSTGYITLPAAASPEVEDWVEDSSPYNGSFNL